jgi:hypothetical protein
MNVYAKHPLQCNLHRNIFNYLNLEYQNHSRERKDLQDPEPIILSGLLAALDRGQKTVILKANPLKIFVFVFENQEQNFWA